MISLNLTIDTSDEISNTLDQIFDTLTFSKNIIPQIYSVYENTRDIFNYETYSGIKSKVEYIQIWNISAPKELFFSYKQVDTGYCSIFIQPK